jgi:ParB family chromosome partitioning protein
MTKGLGRGLSSLIPQKNGTPQNPAITPVFSQRALGSSVDIRDLAITDIDPNPMQPRQQFDPKTVEELAASIDTYGLLEPVVVTQNGPRWQLVAGERRFRAHKLLGRKTIPAIVRTASDLERLELALIENMQRQDLNPMEKAEGLGKLVNDFGLTQEEAAKKLGMARSSLANALRLLDLPTEVQLALANRKITEGHAKVLLGLDTPEEQMRLFNEMTRGASTISVRDLTSHVQDKKVVGSGKKAPVLDERELRGIEDRIQGALGTKVKIQRRSKGAKNIVIETYSDEEFKQVVRKLTR